MRSLFVVLSLLVLAGIARAQPLPIREVTVFKDGHALVLAEATRPVENGSVVLDSLPAPVLGTFWPYAVTPGVRLVSATAGTRIVSGTRPPAAFRELLEANLSKTVTVKEHTGDPYSGKIVSVSTVNERNEALVLLETEKGIKAISQGNIRDIVLPSDAKQVIATTTPQNRLSLQLSGAGTSAAVGVMYLQRGLRWTPSYKITIDGNGMARVQLQATLINDLANLEKAQVNLVIGVPTFAFSDTPDPISLQETFAQVAATTFGRNTTMANRFVNAQAVMGQYASASESRETGGADDPGVVGGGKNEDLFVFTVKNISMKKGERMTLPISEVTLPYTNRFTLELLPRPVQVNSFGGYDYSQFRPDVARLINQPKVMHLIRMTNNTTFPITTAPALVLRGDRVIAQGMTTYAPKGGTTDVSLTESAEITVKRADSETERIANAVQWNGYSYTNVAMKGSIELCNYRTEPTEIEVTRYVLGKVNEAGSKGEIKTLDPLGDDALPTWISQYGNISERLHFTGVGKVTWKVTVPPDGKTCITLGYRWNYYTR